MAFAAANRDNQMSDMNITPLVDVMLVLLVIFMLAAPALSSTLPITLPHKGPPPPPMKEMTVQVQAGDLYALNGQVMTRAQITASLKAALAFDKDLKVNFDVDPNADYESAMRGMAAVHNAGIEAIALPNS
jgi:biopolymer transport protein ExbD